MITVPWWLPAAVSAFILALFIVTWTWAYKDGHEAGRLAERAYREGRQARLRELHRAMFTAADRGDLSPADYDTGPLLLRRSDRMIGTRVTGEFPAATEDRA